MGKGILNAAAKNSGSMAWAVTLSRIMRRRVPVMIGAMMHHRSKTQVEHEKDLEHMQNV